MAMHCVRDASQDAVEMLAGSTYVSRGRDNDGDIMSVMKLIVTGRGSAVRMVAPDGAHGGEGRRDLRTVGRLHPADRPSKRVRPPRPACVPAAPALPAASFNFTISPSQAPMIKYSNELQFLYPVTR